MFGSSRAGGVRGGQDQFSWDDVKVDKHRTIWSEGQREFGILIQSFQAGCYSTTKLIDRKKPVRPDKVDKRSDRKKKSKKEKKSKKKKEKTKHRSASSDSDSESFSKRHRNDPRDHHGPNPSRSSQSGAGARDSHSGGGPKAEHRTLTPPQQHRRHDTDSSSDGHRSPAQSYRRRHDSSSDD